ncbi:MAG: S-adenosylmethionine:tRNA ribosyltransferase-isomerase [Myxococcota bacterium]
MKPATYPRSVYGARLLTIAQGAWSDHHVGDLPSLLEAGDVLVVNDAFTLPASIKGRVHGEDVELRLAEAPVEEAWAVLFGAGDWRSPTELRPPPPQVRVGDRIAVSGASVEVRDVHPDHPRLLRVGVALSLVWAAGRPVQYSYLDRDLQLADVQTPYGTHPWAVEMPSAGRPLTLALQSQLKMHGVEVVALTHAAGLSSTGEPALDEVLPLPERYAVPDATWAAVQAARRVVAVGTSVVRALESAVDGPLAGVTGLRIGPTTTLQVVDGLLSGMHEPGESHFALMEAFADRDVLLAANAHAQAVGYRNHEFGDSTLLWR